MEGQAKYGCGMIANPPPRLTDEQVQASFLPNGCLQQQLACNGCCNPASSPGVPSSDGTCCYVFCERSCCGRPFIVDGRQQLANLASRGDWLQAFAAAPPGSLDARIAGEWLEDARMEHASIASFARFTLDLLAFGAPPELLELAQRAALEEVEHARLCFGLAARYGAADYGPGPLEVAEVRVAASLWDAALSAFDEGCVGETLAAFQALAALELATDPEVRRTLAQIAEQEAAHAELAWRFVSWSAARLGPELARVLERRLAERPIARDATHEVEHPDAIAALHAAGRLTDADKQRVTLAGLRDLVEPCVRALADSARAGCAEGRTIGA